METLSFFLFFLAVVLFIVVVCYLDIKDAEKEDLVDKLKVSLWLEEQNKLPKCRVALYIQCPTPYYSEYFEPTYNIVGSGWEYTCTSHAHAVRFIDTITKRKGYLDPKTNKFYPYHQIEKMVIEYEK